MSLNNDASPFPQNGVIHFEGIAFSGLRCIRFGSLTSCPVFVYYINKYLKQDGITDAFEYKS